MANSATPRELQPHVIRANNARQAIAERFLAAATAEPPEPSFEPLGVPAFLSVRSIRPMNDGSVSIGFVVPKEHIGDLFLPLTRLTGIPLALTIAPIDTDDIEPFDETVPTVP